RRPRLPPSLPTRRSSDLPSTPSAPNFPFTLVEEFCRALASNLRANIHVELLYGRDGHHIAEAIFKGLARALRDACEKDPRVKGRSEEHTSELQSRENLVC